MSLRLSMRSAVQNDLLNLRDKSENLRLLHLPVQSTEVTESDRPFSFNLPRQEEKVKLQRVERV